MGVVVDGREMGRAEQRKRSNRRKRGRAAEIGRKKTIEIDLG